TIGVHYIFPPLSIGLGVVLVIMEAMYLRTRNPMHEQMTKFWVRIFGLVFAVGVATGIVMEFEFGTNWATYARYVGDVFGSPLAMVALGAHFSAIWIVVANSWQQTPAGHHIVGEGATARAEIVDFWAVVFNPSSVDRLTHTLMGCWQAGAWLVVSVGAYYLLKRKHEPFARMSIKIGLVVALVASLGQLATGHASADTLATTQPAKLAAFEGHYEESGPADLYLVGWVSEEEEKTVGIALPGMLSWLLHGKTTEPVTGLRAFAPEDRPPVNVVFQTYHAMVAIGMALLGLAMLGIVLLAGNRLFRSKWVLRVFVAGVLLPQAANQLGWASAEIGRQPWIVYGLLRTSEGLSRVVRAEQVLFSLVLFGVVYALLLAVFFFTLDHKIKHGPEPHELDETGAQTPLAGRRV
ncbi:MAG: cytochrome ubiquinol oxidase subunit I, partial [Polyangiaceae bacterium]|nr:cytochrome ubiquinol oxidase subunit I [Polyangiaceae bacterium]